MSSVQARPARNSAPKPVPGAKATAKPAVPADPTGQDFPFSVRLSFSPVLDFLRQSKSGQPQGSVVARSLGELASRLEAINCDDMVDAMTETPTDHAVLFGDLQTVLLGELGGEHSPAGLMLPFVKRLLHANPRYLALKQAISSRHEGGLNPELLGIGSFDDMMALQAYMVILDRLYDIPLKLNAGMILTATDPADGKEKQFRPEMDFRFCAISTCAGCTGLPELDADSRLRILEHLNDVNVLKELLPPASFSFEGFIIFRMVEVTREYTMASLKQALTDVNALTQIDKLALVEEQVGKLLGKPDLCTMLVAVRSDLVYQLHSKADGCEYMGFKRSSLSEFNQTFFRQVHDSGVARVIPDLARVLGDSPAEREMIKGGIKSLAFIPLSLNSEKVGGLLLQSSQAAYFTPVDVINLSEVLPAFAMALSRGLDNFESQVRALIQEQYTSIHPAVEWKFRKVAMDRLMADSAQTVAKDADAIDFANVWPLYSVSDIRSSSQFRNEAIRSDIQRQLELATITVEAARSFRPLPFLDELAFQLAQHQERLRDNLSSGDEIELLSFLTNEVEPAMLSLEGFGPAAGAARDTYHAAIHPEHRSIYDKRKDFDESVTRINRTISAFIDRVQPEAQAMFPHYFDKNSTDGVDMNMYIGPSMVPDDSWRPMYLKNLRLWQFIVMCRVAHLTWKIRDSLPLPLQTTHLMVVQDLPISIRFNQDEKRFAVDGAYNIRYEIMKKRIDKAVVKGSGQRLTQPDRIAIVYSQHSEAVEYQRYITYLQSKGYLEPGVEELDLEDLQGISGLKALRVAVRMAAPTAKTAGTKRVGLEADFPGSEYSIIELIQREFPA